MTAPPRRWTGSRLAEGVVWPPGRFPTDPADWARWLQPGDRVVDAVGWRVLRFARPRRVVVPPDDGDILLRRDRGLTAVARPVTGPLSVHQLEVAEAGRVRVLDLPASAPEPLLFDLGPVRVVSLEPVGRPPPPVISAEQRFGMVGQKLGLVVPPAEEVAESELPAGRSRLGDWLAEAGARLLRDALAIFRPSAPRPGPRPAPRVGPAIGQRTPWFPRLRALLRGLGQGLMGVTAASGVALGGLAGLLWSPMAWLLRQARRAPAPPSGPSLWSRLWSVLSARFSMWSMSRWLERRHARLLRELVEWFDTGDLLEALRRAVPLGGDGNAPPNGWFLGTLGRRDQLSPTGAKKGGGSLVAQEEVIGLLRRLYEQAHAKLDADGDVERAAWVLAELLCDRSRAVDYLLQHDRTDLAAEWAELLGLPVARCMTLWLQAGEVDRALNLARLRGGLQSTLQLMASGELDGVLAAEGLRATLARRAWTSGDAHTAVQLAWSLSRDADRHLLAQWVAESLLNPSRRHWAVPAAAALGVDSPDGRPIASMLSESADLRDAIARELPRWPPLDVPLAEAVVRAVVVEIPGESVAARSALHAVRTVLAQAPLSAFEDLRADLPPLDDSRASAARHVPRVVVPSPRVGGPSPELLAMSPAGVLAVSLGPMGTRVVAPGTPGRLLPRCFQQLFQGPGPVLAVSQSRSGPCQLWWLDGSGPPAPGPLLPRGEKVLGPWDDDGLLWTFGDGTLHARTLDRPDARPVWSSLRDPAMSLLDLDVSEKLVHALVSFAGRLELLIWDRPAGMVLRWRRPVHVPGDVGGVEAMVVAGGQVFVQTVAGVVHLDTSHRMPGAVVLESSGTAVWVTSPGGLQEWTGAATHQSRSVQLAESGEGTVNVARMLSDDRLLVGWQGGTVDLVSLRDGVLLQRHVVGAAAVGAQALRSGVVWPSRGPTSAARRAGRGEP